MPPGADDSAPPIQPGPLPPAAASSAPLQHQGAVIPQPPGGAGPPTPNAIQQAPNAVSPAPAAAAATPTTSVVGWVDGPASPNNTLPRFGISGADLGILWDNGQTGTNDQVLIAFGDTFGDCSVAGQQWRSNTMFRSGDRNLSSGISVPDPMFGNIYAGSPVTAAAPNFSKQIIDSLNLVSTEVTIIPTAAISVGSTQYINFMSIKKWGSPGHWTTNFSAIATSTDNGENWTANKSTVRPSSFFDVPGIGFKWGDQYFQQGAYVQNGGYVYSFGTPSGRSGSAFLSRVAPNSLLDLSQYDYWGRKGWVHGDPSAAVEVIKAPVSEMSVQWNNYLQKYLVLYTNGSNNVVMRTATDPQGPWSTEQTLVTSTQIPGGIYAPFIHPWSSGQDLYFDLSLWSAYAVMLMHTMLP